MTLFAPADAGALGGRVKPAHGDYESISMAIGISQEWTRLGL